MKVAFLSLYLLLNGPVVWAAADKNDSFEIVSYLMNLRTAENSYIDASGVARYDSLKAYKSWESLYLKYAKSKEPTDKKVFERDHLKILFLIAYIAKIKNDAAMMEALSGDGLPIYSANRELSLEILQELPFLVPSTCYFLSRFFGWEGKNIQQKKPFLSANKEVIFNKLGRQQGAECFGENTSEKMSDRRT